MADTLHLTVTKTDGTVVDITGTLTSSTIVETPPATVIPPPPPPPPPPTGAPVIPATAKTVDMLQASNWAWKMNHDAGTAGTSTGTMTNPFTLNGATVAKFDFNLTAKGGEIYSRDVLGDATGLLNLCYDAVFESPDWSNVACLEMDFNWVLPSRDVTIIGQQLSKYSGTAELTYVAGGKCHWAPSNVPADPSKFTPNVQHSVRWFSKHDGAGNVTYLGVEIDGVYTAFTKSNVVASLDKLNWTAKLLQLQLQFDGVSSGTVASTVYAHKLQVHAW